LPSQRTYVIEGLENRDHRRAFVVND
jgi:hypothetical protein